MLVPGVVRRIRLPRHGIGGGGWRAARIGDGRSRWRLIPWTVDTKPHQQHHEQQPRDGHCKGDQREAPRRAAHPARACGQRCGPWAAHLTIAESRDDRDADDRHRNAEQGDVDNQRRGAAGRPLPIHHPFNAGQIPAQRPRGDEQQRDHRDRSRCRLVHTGHRHTNRLGSSPSWHVRGPQRRGFWGRPALAPT